MGFNTTLVILNDALGDIAKDKEFGKKVTEAVAATYNSHRDTTLYSGTGNCGEVVETHHGDMVQLIAVGGNCGIDLGCVGFFPLLNKDNRPELLRAIRNWAQEELKKATKKPDKRRKE